MTAADIHPRESVIGVRPLTSEAFAPFGDVIEKDVARSFPINNGLCSRFHDLAAIDIPDADSKPIVSIVSGEPYALPLSLGMVERHPLGSQAFIPVSGNPFLVVVCNDCDGVPGAPEAFITAPGQGVNFKRNVWHGILTPLIEGSDFVVIDRGGPGNNLEEHFFDRPYTILLKS